MLRVDGSPYRRRVTWAGACAKLPDEEAPCTPPLSEPAPARVDRDAARIAGRRGPVMLTRELDATPGVDVVSDGGAVSPPLVAGSAAVLVGLLAGALYLQGTFYPVDAFGVTVAALVLIAAGVAWNRDHHGATVALGLGALATWWFVRSISARTPSAFLPFGATVLAFLAAFLVLRALSGRDRARCAVALVAIGAVFAATGVVGVLARVPSLARPAGGVWQASTTLTDPTVSAVVCSITVLLTLATDLRSPFVRIALATGTAGLLATQSHWELLAVGVGALLVPRARWAEALWPLTWGAGAGVAVVATSSGHAAGPAGWIVGIGALVAAAAPVRTPDRTWTRTAGVAAALVVAAAATVAILALPVGASRPSTGASQAVAWSSSVDTWRSAPVDGVGPPRVHTTSGPVATYPGLEPDGYLTTAADGGAVAVLLLLLAGAAVAATIRRRDLLTSCAAGGAVAFAVAGCVDAAWQLPAVGLLGGCAAGLAAVPVRRARTVTPTGAVSCPAVHHGARSQALAAAAWALVVIVVVAAQGLVGDAHAAGGAVQHAAAEPPHATDTSAPGRQILSGPDPTDPFMLRYQGHYYLYTSEGTSFLNVPLRIGSRPGSWSAPRDVLPVLPAWAAGGLTWAPDVHQVSGGWALYFTALVRGMDPATHCVGAAYARTPSGPFVASPTPFICQLGHRGTIDARVIDTPAGLVILSKSEDNANPSVPGPDQNGPTGIYAQRLSADGRTLLGADTRILGPSEPWEGTIVEAPDMVEAWGTWWLFFSGNWYSSPQYGIGVAACQSPFGPCTDSSPTPFLGSNLQGPGPGEASLFEDGGSTWLLYNPFHANDPGPVIPRPVVITRLGFTAQGPYLAAG